MARIIPFAWNVVSQKAHFRRAHNKGLARNTCTHSLLRAFPEALALPFPGMPRNAGMGWLPGRTPVGVAARAAGDEIEKPDGCDEDVCGVHGHAALCMTALRRAREWEHVSLSVELWLSWVL